MEKAKPRTDISMINGNPISRALPYMKRLFYIRTARVFLI
jgi:hypothetical protein